MPLSSLPLLVLGVLANNPHDSTPPNNFTLGANLFTDERTFIMFPHLGSCTEFRHHSSGELF